MVVLRLLSGPCMRSITLTSFSFSMYKRRGKSGGQVRDEYREEYDPGRGGFGRAVVDEFNDDDYR